MDNVLLACQYGFMAMSSTAILTHLRRPCSTGLAVVLALAGCAAEGPAIATGGLGDEPPSDTVDAPSGEPDAPPDAPPGTPDAAAMPPDAHIDLPETLDVQFDTTTNGGQYAPKNIVAVWVTSAGGTFEKTIGRWAGTRRSHLISWVAASGQDADAVSGATRPNHTQRLSVHWDFKDRAGQLVPDGDYTLRMELADRNSTSASQNHEGTFTVHKNGTAATESTSGGGFDSVSIVYSGR
jgi:hypothetical protein